MGTSIVRPLLLILGICASSPGLTQVAAKYAPIPAGFDFPASSDTILAALNSGNESALRLHAWMVFAGLTQPARPQDPTSEAVWETWYSGPEVFGAGPSPQGVRSLQRRFSVPRQFLPAGGGAAPQAIGESNLAFTLFNEELRDHTRTNKLNMASTLDALNSAWPANTPINDRRIKDYPPKAMSLKIVWKLVKKTGFTALPMWDEQAPVDVAPSQPESTWARVVAIDPKRKSIPAGEKRDIFSSGKQFKGSRVVPLSAFYHFQLTQDQATQVNQTGSRRRRPEGRLHGGRGDALHHQGNPELGVGHLLVA